MHKVRKFPINIEIVIAIIIACCMLFLNFFTTSKLTELENSSNEAMFIRNDLPFISNDELTEEILEYRPDSCQMVELYDEQFDLMFALSFDHDHQVESGKRITDHPELMDLLKTDTSGQFKIGEVKNTYEEYVLFQWITNSHGEQRLLMVYNTKPVVDNLWVFSLVCYLVITLVFILLIRLYIKEYRASVTHYKLITDSVRDRVNN